MDNRDWTTIFQANKELGLAFDEHDLFYYKDLFLNKLKRNPTDVELFDLAQSDSEHSRHWFFRGKLFVDGEERKVSSTIDVLGCSKAIIISKAEIGRGSCKCRAIVRIQ
ncbi:unnamed protein product [Cylicostephanus goldi]|uniref:Phosphoribosylformylglycinamidine synthase linker domain-containing protein n=1 Tax=Cylicostephanus goldi TaxID=71465 RepID=A0A3P6UV14_CYLGO|nr:unnamed protein product [Cylicostephanus goldi]